MTERALLRPLMLAISMIFVVAFALQSSASGHSGYRPTAAEADQFAQILTYQELSRLSPKEQQAYLLGLRETMVDFEVLLKARDSSTPQAKRLSAQLLFIKSFIAEAEAKSAASQSRRFSPELVAAYTRSPAYTCDPAVYSNKRIAAFISRGVHVSCPPGLMANCPSGFQNMGHFKGRLFCTNFDGVRARLAKERAAKAAKVRIAKAEAAKKSKVIAKSRSSKRTVASKVESTADAEGSEETPTTAQTASTDETESAEPNEAADGLPNQLNADDDLHPITALMTKAVEFNADGTVGDIVAKETGSKNCEAMNPEPDSKTCNADSIFHPEHKRLFVGIGRRLHFASSRRI